MTEKKKDETAKTPVVRKGHTVGDAVLTVYDDLKNAEGVQALVEAGNAVLVSAGGALMLLHKKAADFINEHIAKKAESIPPENRQPPDPITTAKVIPALNAVFKEENLREMFLNLLAATMDKTRGGVLPAFVEVIKQLSPDEALMLKYAVQHKLWDFPLIDVRRVNEKGGYNTYIGNFGFLAERAKCAQPENICIYMDNLHRLGLIDIVEDPIQEKSVYPPLENSGSLAAIKQDIIAAGHQVNYKRKGGKFSGFGRLFCEAAIQVEK